MRVHIHLVINFLIGAAFLLLMDAFAWKSMLVILVSAVAIDVDHVFFYLFAKRPKKYKSVYEWSMHHYREKKQQLYVFHTLEFMLILFYFSRQDYTYFLVFFSCLVHLLSDQVAYYFHHKDLRKMVQWTGYWHVRKNLNGLKK